MTTTKVALTIPSAVLAEAKKKVKAGRAKSLSAFVSQAVEAKLVGDDLAEALDALDKVHGPPGKEARSWARRVLAR